MDSLFFWFSKLLWFLISPLNFILLLLIAVWLLLLFNAKRLIKPLTTGIVLVLVVVALLPVGSWLLYPLENRFETNPDLPESIEGIVVLSGALDAEKSAHWNQTEVNGAVDRELAPGNQLSRSFFYFNLPMNRFQSVSCCRIVTLVTIHVRADLD